MSRLQVALCALTLTGLAGFSQAQDQADPLDGVIEGMQAAYGGDALDRISAYRITERYIAPATGQSWSPTLVDIGRTTQRFVHDLSSGNLYFENWFSGRGGLFPNVTQVEDGEARTINLVSGKYGAANSPDPYLIAGGTLRTTDTLLARELLRSQEDAEYLGEETFMNRPHHKVRMPFPSSPDLTLYIDGESGLISRMTRENPQLGLLDYVFHGHETRNGIARATRTDFSVAGQPNLISEGREIEFNPQLDPELFRLPGGLAAEGERSDTSTMIVNRLGDNAFHIGQGNAYSIFVDTGSDLVASGGYAGLRERLAKYREVSGNYRALSYLVVSHHHSDHLGGMAEALELGATLVTVPENHQAIVDAARTQPESGRLLDVNGRMSFGDGRRTVELYDVSTLHAHSNLLFYLPSERALFMVDHFGTPYAEGVPVANRNTVSMAEALQGLDIDIDRIVTAHGPRVFSERDFQRSVRDYRDLECPAGNDVCPR